MVSSEVAIHCMMVHGCWHRVFFHACAVFPVKEDVFIVEGRMEAEKEHGTLSNDSMCAALLEIHTDGSIAAL